MPSLKPIYLLPQDRIDNQSGQCWARPFRCALDLSLDSGRSMKAPSWAMVWWAEQAL